jgi:hypothetical protein
MTQSNALRFGVCGLIFVAALASWVLLPRVKNSAIGECNFEATKVASVARSLRPDLRVFVACMAAKGYRSDTDGFLKIAQDERPGDWETKSYEAYLSASSWTMIWPWEVRRPTTYTLIPPK